MLPDLENTNLGCPVNLNFRIKKIIFEQKCFWKRCMYTIMFKIYEIAYLKFKFNCAAYI